MLSISETLIDAHDYSKNNINNTIWVRVAVVICNTNVVMLCVLMYVCLFGDRVHL